MNRVINILKVNHSSIILWLMIPIFTIMSFSHHRWVNPESVIAWDVKSYYAYLPATFIYKDLSLEFRKTDSKKFSKWIWPVQTPTGKSAIITSMGMSVLYLPFFFIAHAIALLSPNYIADGYSVPYAFALHFSALFYLLLGLFALRRFLHFYFSKFISLMVLLIIVFGTNLLYYIGYEAPLPHSYNFALFSIFLLLNKKWHENPSAKTTILIGLLAGFITLIRPTNILILLVLFFWNVYSWKSFLAKILFFIQHYKLVLIMVLGFFTAWLPQFIYWKYISGQFLYFSYEGIGGKFFWDNPQFSNILFSFRKGWFIYTPIALVALAGIPFLKKEYRNFLVPICIFIIINIYVQASWWCWWFGGSFGMRVFIDSYAILAIPLAVLLTYLMRLKWKALPGFVLILFLVWYNLFQVRKYNNQAIHYWWMSRDSFSETLFRKNPTAAYWEQIPLPDYPKARKGIYVAENLITRYTGEYPITPEMLVEEVRKDLTEKDLDRGLKIRGKELGLDMDSLITIQAWNVYETKKDLSKYILPLEKSFQDINNESDSILVKSINP